MKKTTRSTINKLVPTVKPAKAVLQKVLAENAQHASDAVNETMVLFADPDILEALVAARDVTRRLLAGFPNHAPFARDAEHAQWALDSYLAFVTPKHLVEPLVSARNQARTALHEFIAGA